MEPLAHPARRAVDPPRDRAGLRVERVQDAAGRHDALGQSNAGVLTRAAVQLGHRHAGPVGGAVRHQGRRQRAAVGDGRRHRRASSAGFLISALGCYTRPVLAGRPRLRVRRRHRAGHRLHLAGVDADQVVPRPARPGHRHRDHGLRRRRADRVAADHPAAHRVRRHRQRRDAAGIGQTFLVMGIDLRGLHVRRLAARPRARRTAGSPPGWTRRRTSRHAGQHRRRLGRATRSAPRSSGCSGWCSASTSPRASASWSGPRRSTRTSSPSATAPRHWPRPRPGFVAMLSLANMLGRFVWSSTSDLLGRKNMYRIYLGVGALLYLTITLTDEQQQGAVPALLDADPVLLRRGLRHRARLPAGPVRHLPGGRHPRPAAHRLVGRRACSAR